MSTSSKKFFTSLNLPIKTIKQCTLLGLVSFSLLQSCTDEEVAVYALMAKKDCKPEVLKYRARVNELLEGAVDTMTASCERHIDFILSVYDDPQFEARLDAYVDQLSHTELSSLLMSRQIISKHLKNAIKDREFKKADKQLKYFLNSPK